MPRAKARRLLPFVWVILSHPSPLVKPEEKNLSAFFTSLPVRDFPGRGPEKFSHLKCKKLLTFYVPSAMLMMSKEFDSSAEKVSPRASAPAEGRIPHQIFKKGRITMNDNGIGLLGWLAMGFILFSAASILWMAVSMARKGDERRREIVARASCTTFYITLASLGVDILWGVYNSVAHGQAIEGNNPFVQLAVASFTYAICLAFYRRKYGG